MLREGVIKYQLEFVPGNPLPGSTLAELNAWRSILFMTHLIGEDPGRYSGAGYGNVSVRLNTRNARGEPHFAISGTQTGALVRLNPEHYAIVLECWPEQNRVVATGLIKPSSESLTHGVLFALDDSIRFVLHAHAPHIWRHAAALDVPMTRANVAYGTPEMADEVSRLFHETKMPGRQIFAMGGHEDGVITFGRSVAQAGGVMMAALARAFALDDTACR